MSLRASPMASPPPISALMSRTPSARMIDRLSPKPTNILQALTMANEAKKRIRRGYGELNLDETDPKVLKARRIQMLKKRISQTEQLTMQARSDLIELKRDLATYEAEFAKGTNLPSCLIRLSGMANGLPQILESLAQIQDNEQKLVQELHEGLKYLNSQETELHLHPIPPATLTLEAHGLRPSQSLSDFLIFQGSSSVSGVAVLMKVTGNFYYKTVTVNLQTLSGESFFLRIEMPKQVACDIKQSFKTKILPRFYFILEEHELKLCYHERCGEDFLALVVDLKGYQYFVNTVFLTQNGYEVTVRLQDCAASIIVSLELLTGRDSIFEESHQKLCRMLSHHLLLNEDLALLEWYDSVTQLFSVKENESKLMDETFVTAFMNRDDFVPFFKGDVIIKGTTYGVLMLVCRNRTKFEITKDFTTKTIHPRSAIMRFLCELQFGDLSESVQTLLYSLEFQEALLRLFSQPLLSTQ